MGLAEKRAIKDFEDNYLETLQSEVKAAAGFDLAFEVKLDQLIEDGMGHMVNEALPKVFFTPLLNAIKSICADDLGKEGFQAKFKKVLIQNTTGNFNARNFAKVEGTTLVLDHAPFSNQDDVADRTKFLTQTIESAL